MVPVVLTVVVAPAAMPFGLLILALPAWVIGVLGSALSSATLWVATSMAGVLRPWSLEVTATATVLSLPLPTMIVTLIIVAASTHSTSLLILPLLMPATPTILVVVITGSRLAISTPLLRRVHLGLFFLSN